MFVLVYFVTQGEGYRGQWAIVRTGPWLVNSGPGSPLIGWCSIVVTQKEREEKPSCVFLYDNNDCVPSTAPCQCRVSYLSWAEEIWVSHYAIKHSALVLFIANRKMGVRDKKWCPPLIGRPCLLQSNLLAVVETKNSFNSWQRPRSRDQEGGGMIINWSSPSSQAVTHLVSAIYSPNTTTCALMRLVSSAETGLWGTLDKMFLARLIFASRLYSSYQRHKKAVYHAITAYFAPLSPSITNLDA